MSRTRSHPDNLCFPIPPARIDRTLAEAPLRPAVAALYLSEMQRWRIAVATAVLRGGPAIAHVENLTPRARNRMVTLLDTRWDAQTRLWAITSGHDLTPFPVAIPASEVADPMQAVLDVLHWRAAIVTYLTDVWDVSRKPELNMGECAAIGSFVRPARLEGRCVYCLTEYAFDRLDPEDHGCVMASLAHAG